MGAGGVEVTQERRIPVVSRLVVLFEVIALGFDVVGDACFDGGFSAAVGVGGTYWTFFGDGDHVGEASRVAVDGGRGGENDVGDIVLGHGGEEADGAVNIGAVVLEWDLAGLADRLSICLVNVADARNILAAFLRICASRPYLEGSKVDHTVNFRMLFENPVQSASLGDIDIVEIRALAADELDAIERLERGVAEIINDDNLIVSL